MPSYDRKMFFFTDHSEEITCVLTGVRLLAKATALKSSHFGNINTLAMMVLRLMGITDACQKEQLEV